MEFILQQLQIERFSFGLITVVKTTEWIKQALDNQSMSTLLRCFARCKGISSLELDSSGTADITALATIFSCIYGQNCSSEDVVTI
jgi:hypothetical protein